MIDRNNRTILLLADGYPGSSASENEFITRTLTDDGYFVRPLTVAEFTKATNIFSLHGNVLIVPACANLPIETVDALRRYNESVGSVLFLGGPLYYRRIESDGQGGFVEIPLENMLDAGFSIPKPYIREGIAPSYKTYAAKDITEVKPSKGQCIFDGEIRLPEATDVIIPCETGANRGYITDSQTRFIPICDCFNESSYDPDPTIRGRQNGRRGSFAFISLSRTMGDGYEGKGNYGKVETTAIGSAVAAIGAQCPLDRIEGADRLLSAMVKRLMLGLYLMEGGVDGRVYYPGEDMIAGVQVMNTRESFTTVKIEISVETDGEAILFEKERLLCPKSITDLHFALAYDELAEKCRTLGRDYGVQARLYLDGAEIDRIDSTFVLDKPEPVTDPDKYVQVKDDYFTLGGKPWYMAGINYWSTWAQALEKKYYWLGEFDRGSYNPKNVEDDLSFMEEIGLNCLLIRIDAPDLERSVHGVRDFLLRCKRHGIYVWVAYTVAFNSRYYSPEGVELLFDRVFIANNPTVMAFDMEWESAGDQHTNGSVRAEFFDEWQTWLIDRYGSIEAAEQYYGKPLGRDMYGYVTYPEFDLKGGADIRRFVSDCTDFYWKKLMAHLKPLVPSQLITYRLGAICTSGPALAAEYIDCSPLENYGFAGYVRDLYDEGNHIGAVGFCVAASELHRHETGGKPIVWAEYGISVCGTKWGASIRYDHENRRYFPEDIEKQRIYNSYMLEVIEDAHCAGSAPWWWCGGFRYTEMADFGYMMPDGRFSESGRDYVLFCRRMTEKAGAPDTREAVSVEGNVYDYPGGKTQFISEVCVPAYRKARAEGKRLEARSRYDG